MQPLVPVLQAVDYFEQRLRSPAQVSEAADAAGYSLFHFCRVFNQVSGLTPYEYLMRRRLSEAARDLGDQESRVLDIALDYQFGSAEAFARAFKRMFAVQPVQARRSGYDKRIALPRFEEAYLRFLSEIRPQPTSLNLKAQNLIGLMTSTSGWGLSMELLAALLMVEVDPQPRANLWAAIQYSIVDGESLPLTFLGYPGERLTELKGAQVYKVLPAARAFCFDWPQDPDLQPYMLEYIFHTWAPHQSLNVHLILLQGMLSEQRQPQFNALYVLE